VRLVTFCGRDAKRGAGSLDVDNSLLTILLGSGKGNVDTALHRRITKDVMVRQSGEEEQRKKRQEQTAQADSGELNPPQVLVDDEIEPVDFFDPEEFGVRRKFDSSRS
jgi:hypothetical protein